MEKEYPAIIEEGSEESPKVEILDKDIAELYLNVKNQKEYKSKRLKLGIFRIIFMIWFAICLFFEILYIIKGNVDAKQTVIALATIPSVGTVIVNYLMYKLTHEKDKQISAWIWFVTASTHTMVTICNFLQ